MLYIQWKFDSIYYNQSYFKAENGAHQNYMGSYHYFWLLFQKFTKVKRVWERKERNQVKFLFLRYLWHHSAPWDEEEQKYTLAINWASQWEKVGTLWNAELYLQLRFINCIRAFLDFRFGNLGSKNPKCQRNCGTWMNMISPSASN